MKIACYGQPRGPFVSPQRFHELASSEYKTKGVFPFCPQCSEQLDLYGINNWSLSRFDHQNRDPELDPLDDCILANRTDSRFKGLEPDGWDYERGERLRKEFMQDENLKVAYAFCLNLARKGNLPASKFRSMIKRADKKQIWSYSDIPLWVVPYILLTLENFVQEAKVSSGKSTTGYEFHFVFEKPSRTTASALWNPVVATSIKKIFSGGTIVNSDDNPFPILEDQMRLKAGKTNWIRADFLQGLRGLA